MNFLKLNKIILSVLLSVAVVGGGVAYMAQKNKKASEAKNNPIAQQDIIISENQKPTTPTENNPQNPEIAQNPTEQKEDITNNPPSITNTPEQVAQEPTPPAPVAQAPTPAPAVQQPSQNTTEQAKANEPVKTQSTENTSSSDFISEIESVIFTRVNEERAKAGVPALTYNKTMEKYARIKSQDMGQRNYFAHEDPEGKLITEKMKSDGVSYNSWGENIAYIGGGSSSNVELGNEFMTNWMNSPGHRANILSTNFASIGVGVYKIGDTYYATQEFYR